MSEMRFDKIGGNWVVVASDRANHVGAFLRPDVQNNAQNNDEKSQTPCPFCKNSELKTNLQEIYRIINEKHCNAKELIVTPNKYPALGVEGELRRFSPDNFYDAMTGVGADEIIIDTHRCSLPAADYTEAELCNLFKAVKDRVADLNKDTRLRSANVSKTFGVDGRRAVNHPHAELLATPIIPQPMLDNMRRAKKYFMEKGRCLFCDILASEKRERNSRIIFENFDFMAFAPYASHRPFSVQIFPKVHNANYQNVSENSLMQLSDIVKEILKRLSLLLDFPTITLAFRLTPFYDCRKDIDEVFAFIEDFSHWYIELFPNVAVNACAENILGVPINPIKPEDAARFLREVTLK